MKRVLWAFLVGLLFTLFLNAGSIGFFVQGQLTTARMLNHGTDEEYYFALMRDAATGYANLGHADFKELRFQQGATSYAPAVEGLLMKAFGWDLRSIAFFGDLVFPLLAVLFLCLALLPVFTSRLLAGSVAFAIACILGNYWQRSANPQIPYVLLAAWMAVFFDHDLPSWLRFILRALCIALLIYTQLLYASLLLLIEGVFFLQAFLRERHEWRRTLTSGCIFAGTLAVSLLPKLFLSTPSDTATVDTYRRLGVIPSHYPAAPFLQLQLGVLAVLLLLLRRKRPQHARNIDLLLALLLGSLIGLNQAVIHGVDATFGSYYGNVTIFFLWICGAYVVTLLYIRRPVWIGILALLFAGSSAAVDAGQLSADRVAREAVIAHEDAAGVMPVLQWLSTQPGELVVAAPRILGNLVPVYTDHYVLFNTYAFNQRATDRELAERFLLDRALFPSDPDVPPDPTFQPVFGGYPGLLAAKDRTGCRIWSALLGKKADCTIDASSLIIHQDLLAMLKAGKPDVQALLRNYHVDLVITNEKATPPVCVHEKTIGDWNVMKCGG